MRLTHGELPYELDDPTGAVGDNIPAYAAIIQDAVSEAKYYLRVGGAAYTYGYYAEKLRQLSTSKTWRAAEAAAVLIKIERIMMAEVPLCEEQLHFTPA